MIRTLRRVRAGRQTGVFLYKNDADGGYERWSFMHFIFHRPLLSQFFAEMSRDVTGQNGSPVRGR